MCQKCSEFYGLRWPKPLPFHNGFLFTIGSTLSDRNTWYGILAYIKIFWLYFAVCVISDVCRYLFVIWHIGIMTSLLWKKLRFCAFFIRSAHLRLFGFMFLFVLFVFTEISSRHYEKKTTFIPVQGKRVFHLEHQAKSAFILIRWILNSDKTRWRTE